MNTHLLTPERIAEFTRNVFAEPLANDSCAESKQAATTKFTPPKTY